MCSHHRKKTNSSIVPGKKIGHNLLSIIDEFEEFEYKERSAVFYDIQNVREKFPFTETFCQHKFFFLATILCDIYKNQYFKCNKSELCFFNLFYLIPLKRPPTQDSEYAQNLKHILVYLYSAIHFFENK